MRRRLALPLSILVALLAAGGVYLTAPRPPDARDWPGVLVSTREIPALAPLSGSDVKVVRLPPSTAPASALRDPAQAVGKFAATPLAAGQTLFPIHLQEQPAPFGLPRGAVAVAVPVDLASSGAVLRPGDQAAVVAALPERGPGGPATAARAEVIASRLRVLAVRGGQGQEIQDEGQPGGAFSAAAPIGGQVPAAVVLEASPADAVRIVLATKRGQVHLLLDPWGAAAGAPPAGGEGPGR